jgi:hypothetical protein
MSSSHRRRVASLMAGSLFVFGITAVTGSASSADTRDLHAPTADVFTTVVASPLSVARPVDGADGRQHLAYELRIINPTSSSVTITRIETLDAVTDDVVAVYDVAGVASHLRSLTSVDVSGATLAAGSVSLAVLDVAVAPGQRVPRRLVHVLDLARDPDIPGTPSVVRIAPTDVSRDAAVVIDAPLSGDRWVDVNGCCAEMTAHRAAALIVNGQHILAQRFAIDFARLTPDGRLFVGAPDQLASYPYYGTNVTAVDSGVVVKAQDGVPDNVPFNSPPIDVTLTTVPGNYVVIDLGGGHFAGYAHMVPGSLTVRVGDRVQRGQVLGHLGNSGNSDFPHLHFQMTDGPLFLGSDGLPYEMRSFVSEGTLANGDDVLGGSPATIDPALAGQHRRQLPLALEVVSFPADHRHN